MTAETDFRELCTALYGEAVDPDALWDVAKLADTDKPNLGHRLLSASALTSVGAGTALGVRELRRPGGGRVLPGVMLVGDVLTAGELAPSVRTVLGKPRRRKPAGPVVKMSPDASEVHAVGSGYLVPTSMTRRGRRSRVRKAGIGELFRGALRQARTVSEHTMHTAEHGVAMGEKVKVAPGSASARRSGVSGHVTADQGALFDFGGNDMTRAADMTSARGVAAQGRKAKVTQPGPGQHRAPKPPGMALFTPRNAAIGTAAVAGTAALKHRRSNTQTGYDPYGVGKAEDTVDVTWAGEFAKFDDDKRLAFGWATVCKLNGAPVVDRQGDYIHPDDIEEAAYKYVLGSRVGGDMHRRTVDDRPHHVSDLVESFVVTDEKVAAMGLPESTPRGWWVGFKYHDDQTWGEIKKGLKKGFSIHGKGFRKSVDYDELMAGRH